MMKLISHHSCVVYIQKLKVLAKEIGNSIVIIIII